MNTAASWKVKLNKSRHRHVWQRLETSSKSDHNETVKANSVPFSKVSQKNCQNGEKNQAKRVLSRHSWSWIGKRSSAVSIVVHIQRYHSTNSMPNQVDDCLCLSERRKETTKKVEKHHHHRYPKKITNSSRKDVDLYIYSFHPFWYWIRTQRKFLRGISLRRTMASTSQESVRATSYVSVKILSSSSQLSDEEDISE